MRGNDCCTDEDNECQYLRRDEEKERTLRIYRIKLGGKGNAVESKSIIQDACPPVEEIICFNYNGVSQNKALIYRAN